MTQRRLNQDDNNENSDSDVLPADLFQKQGNCCIVCGNIPAETQVAEFRDFMGQYYTILYVWLEEPNGKESIQALIYYQTQGGLNKIQESMNSRIYKFSIIDIEQQNDQLKVISEKFLILQSEKDTEQQKKYVKLLVNNGIIDQIEMFLKKINADIFEENQKGEKKSVASANDVLLTKFACNILILIHEYAPSSFQMAKYVIVAEELMKFLQNTPAHNINTSHIQALLMIMSNPNYYQQDLSRKEDILTLSHLLDHTNLEVKQYVLYLMIHILNVADSRTAQRKPHPFHEDLKRDGVAFFVYQNCLLNGDSVNMKNNAAIVLSVLLRAQKLQLNMLTALILQFKSMLDEKNDCTMQAQTLNLLCGIAANKSNIPDLVSDHFIETISKFIKSQYEDVKSYSLELLMIFAQNGYDTLIRNTLGDMKFLELVGDSYFPLDTQAIQLTMKWCKDEELQKMKKLQELVTNYLFSRQIEDDNNYNWIEKIIQTILQFICIVVENLIESNQSNNTISSLTVGMINISCTSFIIISRDNEQNAREIIKAGILTQLVKLLQYFPIEIIKSKHIIPLQILTEIKSMKHNQFLFKHGTVQILSRFLMHPSQKVVFPICKIILNIIRSISIFYSSQTESLLILPNYYKFQFIDDQKLNETIEIFNQIITSPDSNENISQIIIKILSTIYRASPFPSQILEKTISYFKRQIIDQNDEKSDEIDISDYTSSLKSISRHQENHEVILNSGIIEIFADNIHRYDFDSQTDIIELTLIMFDIGNQYTRQQIKTAFSIELFEGLIIEKEFFQFFLPIFGDEDIQDFNNDIEQELEQNLQDSIDNNNFQQSIFSLLSYFKEEERMNQLALLRNQIQQHSYINKEINLDKEIINKDLIFNQWEIIQQMIQIVKEIKEKDLQIGAMKLIRDEIYIILFQQAKNQQTNEIQSIIDQLQQIINNEDNNIRFSLIDENIFNWIIYTIKECQFKQQLELLENIISLTSSIAVHGSQMGNDNEINYFINFQQEDPIHIFKSIILEQIEDQDEQIKLVKNRIKLQTAICISCLNKNNKYFNIQILYYCINIFKYKFESFIKNLKQFQYSNKIENESASINQNIEQQIFDDVITLQKILSSISSLTYTLYNAKIFVQDFKIIDEILPLIHISCNCILGYNLPFSNSFSNIISQSYNILSNLFNALPSQDIEIINSNHNLYNHIIPSILTIHEQDIYNNISDISSPSKLQIVQQKHQQFVLISSAINILQQMVKSEQIDSLVKKEPNLIHRLFQFATYKESAFLNSVESSELRYRSLKVISQFNMVEAITTYEWMIHQHGELQLFSKLMSSAGGYGYDNDNILTYTVLTIQALIIGLNNKGEQIAAKSLIDEILYKVLDDGLKEECDALIFHTENMDNQQFRQFAKQLMQNLNI